MTDAFTPSVPRAIRRRRKRLALMIAALVIWLVFFVLGCAAFVIYCGAIGFVLTIIWVGAL